MKVLTAHANYVWCYAVASMALCIDLALNIDWRRHCLLGRGPVLALDGIGMAGSEGIGVLREKDQLINAVL